MQTDTFYKDTTIEQHDIKASICLDYFNERLRVDDYRGNIQSIVKAIHDLAEQHSFSKVIVKARAEHLSELLSLGFLPEAWFSRYFNGSDCVAMCKYYSNERKRSDFWVEEDRIMDKIHSNPPAKQETVLPESYSMRQAVPEDGNRLAGLYSKVFEVYPTPMNDSDYIEKTMENGTVYFVIEHQGEVVSAASADINQTYHNAELTDCATLQEHRKYGLMKILIDQLEQELKSRHIYCAYSIARSLSFGMNAVFSQRGYLYQGRLIKNCLIFDKYEDMNLWVKDLSSM
ncbi:putative beta-lysine N-acetyltransferase [Fictibacillus solisalsi]|uniref:Putative beta-lysine N-acetyltransferase n=1 Tax=Fictibacillus solisalsi TaxID=459525 RepID=A0A1G9V7E4_9BACL|nr:putative beta-lysine N-acetyltransferase [Fictibacillus solisalsi]SDM67795.1 putative beta-lysine N-acetyltransferase [Fictibacillus solisalsi]